MSSFDASFCEALESKLRSEVTVKIEIPDTQFVREFFFCRMSATISILEYIWGINILFRSRQS